MRFRSLLGLALLVVTAVGCGGSTTAGSAAGEVTLLNVSYDPTRELWKELNGKFVDAYARQHDRRVSIKQSHGGSSTQALAVIDGLEADVVTLAMWTDTNQIHKKGLIAEKWETKLPNRSLAYTSTIVFVVRKGNPKKIQDWDDLIKDDVKVITPNPKTSGNGKLSLLAAWGHVLKKGGTEEDAKEFVKKLYKRVPVLDTGARAATATFAQKRQGDVHLTWENEAHLEIKESKGNLEIVYPKRSIRAEPHVAVVDKNVDRHRTREAAEEYLKFLYTPEAQEVIARHYYRPSDESVLARNKERFPEIELFGFDLFGTDHDTIHQKFIAEGGVFDQIYKTKAN